MCHTRFPSACYLLDVGPAVVLRDSMCRQREYVSAFCQVVSTIAGALPDMDFVVNCIDEPRVLLGEGTAAQRMSAGCNGASQVLVQLGRAVTALHRLQRHLIDVTP